MVYYEKWGLFFSYVDNDQYADYISELVRSEKGIMIAEKIVKRMSEADDNWSVQNSRYKAECDRNSIEYYAEKKGHEEGLQEGLQQGLEQGAHQQAEKSAINMLAEGDSPEKVSRCTGLPLNEVLKLNEKMSEDQVREIVNEPSAVKA